MLREDIEYCRQRIAEEQGAEKAAPSWEAGCVHQQLALLYEAQLAALMNRMNSQSELAA
jgi:hypothetical protein